MIEEENQDRVTLFNTASSLPGRQGISFIGPFGSRVSFASQQARAFNTVWAWSEERAHKPNARVAVIGGGIAGLTTSAALVAKRHTVTLFEANTELVKCQKNARHRYVHPTVNFWPSLTLKPTTSQPYLDWYEATSDVAAKSIEREWRRFFLPRMQQLRLNRTVTDIKRTAAGTMKVVFTEPGHTSPKSELYDHVFVATGFGAEIKVWDTDRSYWDPDDLDGLVESGHRSFTIAGTGDGGLIDTLRILQEEFEGGHICFRLIKDMEASGLRPAVTAIEVEAKKKGSTAEAAKYYARAYSDLVERSLSNDARALLRSRVTGMTVTLVGTLPFPYAVNSAPVHKIMIAAALADGAVRYTQGKVTRDPITDEPMIKTAKSLVPVAAGNKVVMRIGPGGGLNWLLKKGEIASLKTAQLYLGDILRPAKLPDDFFESCNGVPLRDPLSQEFIEFRKDLAEDYLWAKFRATCDASGLNNKKGFRVYYAPDSVDHRQLPTDLFGIACFIVPEPVAEWV
ncbi:NAD(P)-binding protein [Devosia crocina]|nr:NAD(P)-binding protein [Devosia crocina]